jgi:hypothetical protein
MTGEGSSSFDSFAIHSKFHDLSLSNYFESSGEFMTFLK